VELGLGAGWYEEEHLAYGIPFPPVAERFERLEEQLAIVTGLWETPVGGSFSFKGKHYQLTGSPALPKPLQQPRPRSSSAALAPNAHRGWRPHLPTSTTCPSTAWPMPGHSSPGCEPPARNWAATRRPQVVSGTGHLLRGR